MTVIGLAGGSASGKTSLARRLCELRPGTGLISLDDHFRNDRSRGPWTAPDAAGERFFDLNHPDALDFPGVLARIQAAEAPLLLMEGNFALHFTELRDLMALKVYLHLPDDLRLGRKVVRNFRERGVAPEVTFQNYLQSGRPGHERFLGPSVSYADVVLDGLKVTDGLAGAVLTRLGSI